MNREAKDDGSSSRPDAKLGDVTGVRRDVPALLSKMGKSCSGSGIAKLRCALASGNVSMGVRITVTQQHTDRHVAVQFTKRLID